MAALRGCETLAITTFTGWGGRWENMLNLTEEPRGAGTALRVLNLGAGDVDTGTPMGSRMITVVDDRAQMEFEIRKERVGDSVPKCRATGFDLGGRRNACTERQIRSSFDLLETG